MRQCDLFQFPTDGPDERMRVYCQQNRLHAVAVTISENFSIKETEEFNQTGKVDQISSNTFWCAMPFLPKTGELINFNQDQYADVFSVQHVLTNHSGVFSTNCWVHARAKSPKSD